MTDFPKVSIVVLTWNDLKLVLAVLKDISKLKVGGIKAETVVVDNGSTDGTGEKLKSYKLDNMPFKLIENGENLGFAAGNNVGIKDVIERGADYILLLNNDVILPKDLLVKLVAVIKGDNKIGFLTPLIYFAKGYEFHKERYKTEELGRVIWYAGGVIDWDNVYSSHRGVNEVDGGQYDAQTETDFINGACAMIRSEALERTGFFDEKFFLYWEDADLSMRVKEAGWKVVYSPASHVWHKVAQASGIGSDMNDYFLTRNRLIFGMRYARARTKVALIRESFSLLSKGRKWQRIGTKDFYLRRLGKGSWPPAHRAFPEPKGSRNRRFGPEGND